MDGKFLLNICLWSSVKIFLIFGRFEKWVFIVSYFFVNVYRKKVMFKNLRSNLKY